MKLTPLTLLSVLVLSALALPLAAEMIDNPAYQNWSKYKPGTFTQIKGQTTMTDMGMVMDIEMKSTLLAITPEKATVEIQTSSAAAGNKMPPRTVKQDIPAKVEKGKENLPELPPDQAAKVDVKDVKTGKDSLVINGQTLATTTHEATIVSKGDDEGAAMTMHTKTWSSPEIPGGMVKTESAMTAPMKSTTTMTLVDYKIVK